MIYKFFKVLLTKERTLIWQHVLAVPLSPAFLNARTADETFQQSGKQISVRHIKNSAALYENSDSQFFRTTTGVQPGPDAFGESILVLAFLISLAVS